MPSNRELQDSISVASTKLGVEPDLSGNNAELAARLKDLNSQLAQNADKGDTTPQGGTGDQGGETDNAPAKTEVTPPDGAASDSGDAAPASEATPPVVVDAAPSTVTAPAKVEEVNPQVEEVSEVGHVIAPGRSLTTKRGVLGAGAPVFARDFPTAEDFDRQCRRKTIVKGE